jgi:hypothetical protein
VDKWTKALSVYANAVKDGESPERIAELQRDFQVAREAQRLRDLARLQPPLTPDQRCALATLVLNGGDVHAAA